MIAITKVRLRLAAVALLAASLASTIVLTRRPEGQFATGLSREKFWTDKVEAPPSYDLVLSGDSRTLCDLDPVVFEKRLAGTRVYNFGFNYAALSPDYIDAAIGKLAPGSKNRSILIGVTPRALTPLNTRVSGYREESRRSTSDRFFNRHLNYLNNVTRPFSLANLVAIARPGRMGYKDFYPSGYMAVSLRPPDPKADLKVYQNVFLGNKVSNEVIDALMAKIRELSLSGIRVYGIRLPISPEIFDCERRLSGFDEQLFVQHFEQAGGVWLQSPAGSYTICDGSHLDAAAVGEFSARLADEIARRRPSVSPTIE